MSSPIHQITFNDILPIWRDLLWPNRVSAIEPTSAMKFLGGYDMQNMQSIPAFFGYIVNNKIVGVYGGHMCADTSYRTRGVYVFPEYRKMGIARQLITTAVEQGWKEGASFGWAYAGPRSWPIFEKVGFKLVSDWEPSETGSNAYCRIDKGM